MKEKFDNRREQAPEEENKREKFENLIDELGVNSMEITSFYAQKISKMPGLEIKKFEDIIKYAKFRMERQEWDKAYYYLNFIFFDAFRDSENVVKNKNRNQIIDLMNECLENLRIKKQ
ncbi:MAG: hypothetical protein V1667_03165 [bacterium]